MTDMIHRAIMADGAQFLMDVPEDDTPIRVSVDNGAFWMDLPFSWAGSGRTLEAVAVRVATFMDFDEFDVGEIVPHNPSARASRPDGHLSDRSDAETINTLLGNIRRDTRRLEDLLKKKGLI
jgi:hypothetical protein